MRKNIFALALILLSTISSFGQNVERTNQVILKLKRAAKTTALSEKTVGNREIDIVNHTYKALKITKQLLGKNSNEYIYLIAFSADTDLQKVIDAYIRTGQADYAEPDYTGSAHGIQDIAPNDNGYPIQWGLKNDGTFSLLPSTVGADINMEAAWGITQGNSSIIVAIIDSGAKLNHPEFAGRIWTNTAEIPNNFIDDDNNGYIDDVQGWDFVNNDSDPTDDNGHGTNVAGIIGANGNNSIGYAGVDWNCKLMILKGTNNIGNGLYSGWAAALYYATDNGARIINMSLGGASGSATLHNALNYALSHNVEVVVSMGNSNSNIASYPAAYSGVIAVGATDANDHRTNPFFWSTTSGSNYGAYLSVVAPGNYIYGLNNLSDTDYSYYWGGTSQAAPLVTGLSALLLSQNANLTPGQIKVIIESTAQDQVGNPTEDVAGWDQYYGHGRINAFLALSSPLAVENFGDETSINIKVFPNPAKSDFTVTFPLGTKEIQVFNTLGQLLQTRVVAGETADNFQMNESGVYYIEIVADGKKVVKKVVVG